MSAVWWVLLAFPVGVALAVLLLRLWPGEKTGPGQVTVDELREREDVDSLPYYPPTTTGTFPIVRVPDDVRADGEDKKNGPEQG
ncbi:hypothetical protein JOF53_005710 [Crossiella equi]|uniref:Uncharacterized protein n=1 Tax=Crossiella equi TaxID=130796 RepID=A0ABS5AJU3_9PSEU|nr:hypothetical protein [Crossiella equi]MBP2476838.1 hypothetical protein [Crossiella equi]